MGEWPLQDARSKFSALVDAALAGEPQRVSRRGQPAVVVLATEAATPTLVDLLLEIPQDDQEFGRLSLVSSVPQADTSPS